MIVGALGRIFQLLARLLGPGGHPGLAEVGGELVRLERRRAQRPETASR